MDEWCVIDKDGLTVKTVTNYLIPINLPTPTPRPMHKPPRKPKKSSTTPIIKQPK